MGQGSRRNSHKSSLPRIRGGGGGRLWFAEKDPSRNREAEPINRSIDAVATCSEVSGVYLSELFTHTYRLALKARPRPRLILTLHAWLFTPPVCNFSYIGFLSGDVYSACVYVIDRTLSIEITDSSIGNKCHVRSKGRFAEGSRWQGRKSFF